jgi:hypothetical protein
MSNNIQDCPGGYFTNGMATVDGAQMTAANSRIPVDTGASGGEAPQSGGIIPGTLPIFDTALTAHVGGGKASAKQLGYGVNRVSVCGTAANSTLLPYAFAGALVFLANDGAASTTVFGKGTDTIDAVATATGNAMAAAKRSYFVGISGSGDGSDAGAWISIAGAKIS